MAIHKQLFIGSFILNGRVVSGPVTTGDFITFVWINRNSGDDLYFYLKKIDNGWYEAEGGQAIKYPQSAIDAVGLQIDDWLQLNSNQ